MLILWINMWITAASLCKNRWCLQIQKESDPFTIRKITPFLILSKARFSNGLFHFSGILRILKEIEDPSMI